MENIDDGLERLERQLGGTLGVVAVPLAASATAVEYRADEEFPAASTIKVFVLQTLLEEVAAGRASLDEEVPLAADDQVTGSGVLKALTPGRLYTLGDLATLMIIVSDNSATNLLIERLGVDGVNAVCERHGWRGTHLAGKLQKGLTHASFSSPRDLADAFVRLWRGELLPPSLTAVAQGIYRRQQLTDNLGRDIGYDAYSTETGSSPLVIASKSGSLRGVRNDAGIIDDGRVRYALAVMTKGCADARYTPENLGNRVLRGVSKLLYEHYAGGVE